MSDGKKPPRRMMANRQISGGSWHIVEHEVVASCSDFPACQPVSELSASHESPRVHFLKCERTMLNAITLNEKTAEFRRNDKGFEVGDKLVLFEPNEDGGFQGIGIKLTITHIVSGPDFGVPEGFAMLSFRREGII